jgi:hypothetical protein
MKYQAKFYVDGGISPGFALKSPYHETREESITAEDNMAAIKAAATLARKFSLDYLSNPETDFTTVTLLNLYDDRGNLINQREVLKKAGITKCHMLEHLTLVLAAKCAPTQ